MFRLFAWPIVWIIGVVLVVLEQLFINPPDHRPQFSGLLGLIPVIANILIVWSLLTLVPYFIYRKVDQKWGNMGKRNAILIVLAINILLFSFFAFQIYVLQNSYRSLGSKSGRPTNPWFLGTLRLLGR